MPAKSSIAHEIINGLDERPNASIAREVDQPSSSGPDSTATATEEAPLNRPSLGQYIQTPPSSLSQTPPDSEVSSLKYLLVDDNAVNLRVLTSHVKKLGRPLSTATNGLEAFEAYCANPGWYSCIFMDISMPVMDGFEAIRRIRALEREVQLKPTTIIALFASQSAWEEAHVSGADSFLSKPVRLKDIAAVLESHNLL